MGMKLISIKDENWEKQLSEEKRKELADKVLEKVEELYNELWYMQKDVNRIMWQIQKAKDTIQEWEEEEDSEDEGEDNIDNRREVPWYLKQEYNDLQEIIEKLSEKLKNIDEHRNEIEKVLKFTKLVKGKLYNEFSVEDAEGIVDIAFKYGHVMVFFGGSTVLSEVSVLDDIAIKDLIASAFKLISIKAIIMGIMVYNSLEEGKDMYEGEKDEIRTYVDGRLKEILNLLKTQ
jgi:predicted RNase H-like nuclease (RuvC/YqgF family)